MARLLCTLTLSSIAAALASCAAANPADRGGGALATQELATFAEPWSLAIDPGTGVMLVTERKGALKVRMADGRIGSVSGVPAVDYGGQGGLGEVAFAPAQPSTTFDRRTIYLTYAEKGDGDTRGAALGKGDLVCAPAPAACRIDAFTVIWRQVPKVTGRGHYSHRIAFSPDAKFLFLSSGERQKFTPAQDLSTNLGKGLRLNLDGTAAPGNPFEAKGGVSAEVWSYGHRNVLGLKFDAQGRLWDLEHGPAGGDELNLVKPGANYGWPLVSDGDHYDGRKIPRNATRPDLARPAISWNPVIAPGDFIFAHDKGAFAGWAGEAVIAGMGYPGLVRVKIDGEAAREVERLPLGGRVREIAQAPDGTIYVLMDGDNGRLLKLVAKR